MKKYLFVIDQVKHGGAENILLRYASFLENRSYEIEIFVLFGNSEVNVLPGIFRENYYNFLSKFIQQFLLRLAFRKIKKRYKPDYIFSFLERSNFIALDTSNRNEKIIVSVHNNLSQQYKKYGKIKQALIRYLIKSKYNKKSSQIIAVSKSIERDLINNFNVSKEKITVINNSVDKKLVSKAALLQPTKLVQGNNRILISIGRATHQKAQWKIIKSLYYLLEIKRYKDIELFILGDGEYTERLKNLSKELKIVDRVNFLGFVKNPYPYLEKANLLVLPSVYEGFPVVVSESIALNTPFVGSRKAIPVEIFNNRSSWENATYENIHTQEDFSSKIFQDDIVLSELIIKGLQSGKKMLEKCSLWIENNTQIINFEKYLSLGNDIKKHL